MYFLKWSIASNKKVSNFKNMQILMKLTVIKAYPKTLMIPAKVPISMAPQGWMAKSAHDPIATPPAKVAFSIWTCGERNFGKSLAWIYRLTKLNTKYDIGLKMMFALLRFSTFYRRADGRIDWWDIAMNILLFPSKFNHTLLNPPLYKKKVNEEWF